MAIPLVMNKPTALLDVHSLSVLSFVVVEVMFLNGFYLIILRMFGPACMHLDKFWGLKLTVDQTSTGHRV